MATLPLDADRSAQARLALACLDLTSLNAADTEADIASLCQRAMGRFGAVAAICVWPRFAASARRQLPGTIHVAAVANFPEGSADIPRAVFDTRQIVDSGAQEVDVVLPYAQLLAGDELTVVRLLTAVRSACTGLVLKVILETSELKTQASIGRASWLSLEAGADFLKTSTGKTALGATSEGARTMLQCIAAHPRLYATAGFKGSGGIRTVADAAVYFALVREILGPQALTPARLRIGASSLLDDVEAILGGGAAGPPPRTSY
ncbi:MAG: deoxyribose-phosphate aldolase [Rhodoferax sp.]|nr:deoxyribose-phosphate aldolase [Rhodoferax sp.]